MSVVFADTFYWIALINPGDRSSQQIQRLYDILSGGNVHTTEEVLAEVSIRVRTLASTLATHGFRALFREL